MRVEGEGEEDDMDRRTKVCTTRTYYYCYHSLLPPRSLAHANAVTAALAHGANAHSPSKGPGP
jgi:hypothetical protein